MNRLQLIDELRRIVGPDGVVDNVDDLKIYGKDWCATEIYEPDAAILPTNTDQIAAVVRLAAQAGLPVVPRGAGTGLAGGAQPHTGGIVISTTRMNTIALVETGHRRARVQPGVINYDLTKHLAPYGYYYAPDPASWKMCTIGGNIANNSGGPHCLKHGVTTNHILALEVVLHDGTVLWTGDGVGDAAGYDLTGLFVGSEGTLCIATSALVRITRHPEARRVALAFFPTMVSAGTAVSNILAAGHLPTSLEVMDATTIHAVNTAFQFGLPTKAAAALIVEVDGVEDGLDHMLEEIGAICRQHGAMEVQSARTAAEQEHLWAARKSAFEAFKIVAPDYYLADTVVPRTQLPAMLEHIGRLSREYNMPIANVFHAGDGNLHPLVLYDPQNPDEVERAHQITAEVLRLSIAHGGAISGEHGIGLSKRQFMPVLFSNAELQAQATIYAIFNPHDRLNPAKMFPSDMHPLHLAEQRRQRIAAQQGSRALRYGFALVLASEFEQIVGPNYVLQGEATAPFAVQGQRPRIVVLPGDVEELAHVMASCHQFGASVVPWGGGTQQHLGHLEAIPDVVIVTRRLAGIRSYTPDDLTISVGAGTTLTELQAILAEHNQMLPLDAPLPEQATIGGLVATATDGPRRPGYGTLRDLLLGLTVVEVDGTVIQCGGQVVKNVSAYDLVKLFHGSYGTLGVIAGVNLRTYPRPISEASLLAIFAERDQALAMLADLAATQLTPTACEYLDRGALRHLGIIGGAALAMRAEGLEVACQRHTRDLSMLAERHGAIEHRELRAEDQRRLWAQISNLSAINEIEGDAAVLRIAVSPGDLGDALEHIETCASAAGLEHASNARAMSGVIYTRMRGSAEGLQQFQQQLRMHRYHMHILACAPTRKTTLSLWGAPPAGIDLMRAIKRAFDPAGKLNPGRYIVD